MFSLSKRLLRREFSCLVRQFSSALPPHKETKIRVLDADINVMESIESPSNAPVIFYLPGNFGSIEMDFKPIFHELNREKYKWIAWDPLGHGKSFPPKRFPASKSDEFANVQDARYIKELMNIFGYQKYVFLSWSGGAVSGIIIASEQPEKVSGLITWGCVGYITQEMFDAMHVMKKMGPMAVREPRKTQLLNMYGEEYLLEMWNGWCDETIQMKSSKILGKGGSFQNSIRTVQCPALVIHGMKDALIAFSHAQYLNENLKNSRLHTIETGTHNLHLRNTKEFVQTVQQFVDEVSLQPK